MLAISLNELSQREGSLLISGRPLRARKPISVRCAQLTEALEGRRQPVLSAPFAAESIETIAHLNRGALLLSQCGDLDKAMELCLKAIGRCRELQCSSGVWGWEWLAITPYQNIGRLHSLSGDYALAVEIYHNIYRFFVHSETLSFNDLTIIPNDEHNRIAERVGDNFEETAPYAYLQTMARVHFAAGRYLEIIEVTDALQVDTCKRTAGFVYACHEVRAKAKLALDDLTGALAEAVAMKAIAVDAILPDLLLCECYLRLEKKSIAIEVATTLSGRLLGRDDYAWIYGYLCAMLLARCDQNIRAKMVADQALTSARSQGEDPGLLKVLTLAAILSAGNKSCSDTFKEEMSVLYRLSLACEYRLEAAHSLFDCGRIISHNGIAMKCEVSAEDCLQQSLALACELRHTSAKRLTQKVRALLDTQTATHSEAWLSPSCVKLYDALVQL